MSFASSSMRNNVLNALVFASVALLVGGFVLINRDFGIEGASVLSIMLALPLFVAIRLRRRSFAVQQQEVSFFLVLFCAAAGGSAFTVHTWYSNGVHHRHLEDVQWYQFESEFRRDPAFQSLNTEWNKKTRYYLVGEVSADDDLERLRLLALKHQVRWPLDGPFAHSKSVTVRMSPQE